MTERIETVIVGGGQAGLAMSFHLQRLGREHIVLERGRIAERWRSERWDSLAFQFPNWMIRLPGYEYGGTDPDGFMHRDGVVHFIEEYAQHIAPPIRCGVRVTSVGQKPGGKRLVVATEELTFEAANVVIATGPYQEPAIPAFSAALPSRTRQIAASRYANAAQLPPGRVLVVGSGGSGGQIAEDLLESGRDVFLSVRGHRRVPRRYRGRDFGWWQETMGRFDQVGSGGVRQAPLLTGVNGGRDVDLRRMAAAGVMLVGSLQSVEDGRLLFADDLAENLAKGDEAFNRFIWSVDEYVREHGLSAPVESRATSERALGVETGPPVRALNLREAGISTVIWATGYRYEFGWVQCPVLDGNGAPVHRRGISGVPGVYFLGLPLLHKIKSAFLWGVGEDAAYLAERIATRT